MSSAEESAEAQVLVDSYGAQSAFVRLAQLCSPACRIEPQLIRRLRLDCVADADVSVEQEFWHSELVDARGATITLRAAVSRVLRDRLREWRRREPAIVERARTVMLGLHADLPPLLVLEDRLAWAEVFDENDLIRTGAEDLLRSLLARREGLDHWLGRAWSGLPNELKQSSEGRQLAQVAAARGASITEDSGAPAGDQVAHMLPLVPLPLRLHGLRLTLNAPPAEATHVLDIPETHPRCVSVMWPDRTENLVFNPAEARDVDVPPGVVVIRTLTGAEYELEADATSAVFEIEMLPAGRGTSLLIRYGTASESHLIVVDCGTRRTGALLADRLRLPDAARDAVELLVITHVDDDRIGGAIPLLQDKEFAARLRDVWFNGFRHAGTGRPELI